MSISNKDDHNLFTNARSFAGKVYAITELSFDPGHLWAGLELRYWNRATVLVSVGVPLFRLDVRLSRLQG